MALDLNCPSCQSDATQRLSIVYAHGISDINTSSNTGGIGFGRGGIGLGLAKTKTKGTSQTAMSQQAAPPPKKRILKPLGLILLATIALSFFASLQHSEVIAGLVVILFPLGCLAWIVFAVHYNVKKWPPLKAIWDDSFICNRCNNMFHATRPI